MSQKTSDQGWQQLQAHIDGFLFQTLRNDVQKIEYKPRFIAQLLEMPSERHHNEFQEMKG
jgi:CDP-diacylglycerol pyrophosphatase